jgi:hypothetical protein
MAKCPKCSTRKAKRSCPAIGGEICPACCAENRLKTIRCPETCPNLQGEYYQHRRRQERAESQGREFLADGERLFPDRTAREFAFRLQADIYYFLREHGVLDDAAIAAALDTLKGFLSKIFVPPEAPNILGRFLIERMADGKRYPTAPGFSEEDRRRAVGILASHARSLAREGGSRYRDSIARFFDALDFEADLDYSPLDSQATPPDEAGTRRSPGGLILPSGM